MYATQTATQIASYHKIEIMTSSDRMHSSQCIYILQPKNLGKNDDLASYCNPYKAKKTAATYHTSTISCWLVAKVSADGHAHVSINYLISKHIINKYRQSGTDVRLYQFHI